MSLDVAFNSAVSALRLTQRSLATTANNIANVETEGYTRKVQTQQPLTASGQGLGVLTGPVERLFDQALHNELLRRNATVGDLDVRNSYLRRVEEVQGSPDAGINVAARLTDVRDKYVRLAATPESNILQTDVLIAADEFARTMRDVSRTILDTRNAADSELSQSIAGMNSFLSQIETLDSQIILAKQKGSGAGELEDQRDAAIVGLSKLVEIRVLRRNDGSVAITTASGVGLFDKVAQTVNHRSTPIDHTSFHRTSPPGSIPAITVGEGSSVRDITSILSGGRIGGLLALRDDELPRMQAELDNLAFQVEARMRSNGTTLFTKADGVSAPPGIPTAYVGFAGEIRVAQAMMDDPRLVSLGDRGQEVLSSPAGGIQNPPFPLALGAQQVNRIINNVFESPTGSDVNPHTPFASRNLGPDPLANMSSTLPSAVRLTDYAASLVARHGTERGTIDANLKAAESVLNSIEQRYNDATGVNMDDELAQLQLLQRSYASAAQVLRSIDRMVNDLFAVR
ncbi:MAG: putative flagellar hook-associated protein FlgK [Pseudomonadota bacterium]|jgi:flagellar hook-associated protein 1 FlgK